jgi:hypothetical protein
MSAMDWREQDPGDMTAALAAAVGDAATGWSLGTFGALAEFHRGAETPAEITATETGWSVRTDAGAMFVERHAAARIFPYEMLSKMAGAWSQGVLVCLPAPAADADGAAGLEDMGDDADGRLFDLGLGVPHLRPCIRTDAADLIALLRQNLGTPFLDLGHDVVAAIKHAQPVRVFISNLGRIEVAVDIPESDGTTPMGPHTHIMPTLLKKGQGQSANIDLPDGWVAALAFFPPNPARDILGERRTFDAAAHERFQDLMMRFAPREIVAAKNRVREALAAGNGPDGSGPPETRAERTALRVALRQWQHTNGASAVWRDWTAAFDGAAARQLDDAEAGEP